MAPTVDGLGQAWTLQPLADGTFRLIHDLAGQDLSLDTTGNTPALVFAPGGPTGQGWTLTATGKVESTVAIPGFAVGVQPSEGATDFTLYADSRPKRTVRAVMVFVDFKDAQAPGGTATAAALAGDLLGNGLAQKLFHEQSYGGLTLDVTVRSDLGWQRMPGASSDLDTHETGPHRTYIERAAALFTKFDNTQDEVTFSAYHLVFIVAPEQAALGGASAFAAPLGSGASSSSGEIRLAVTFKGKSSRESFTTVVHEAGHLFGLPDHYPAKGNADNSLAGCWSIMSDIFHATGFLGWHRHKNGWLEPSRKTYLTPAAGPWWGTLHPLSSAQGLSMVVIPVDDPVNPSQVLVIELAQRVRGKDGGESHGRGVLLYSVDTTLGPDRSPVAVLPKHRSFSDNFGNLFEAPYLVDDKALASTQSEDVILEVIQRFGESYYVTIRFL